MNRPFLILPAISLFLAACETGGPISSGGYDPLDAAGGGSAAAPAIANTVYRPGVFVKTSMDNAAFFRKRPSGNADADKVLPANTPMKVISDDGNYVRAELDSGEVGFIPSVMVIDQSASAAPPLPSENEYQVWPPVGGPPPIVEPLDPSVPVIPPVIDPDAPVETPVEPTLPEIPPVSTPLPDVEGASDEMDAAEAPPIVD